MMAGWTEVCHAIERLGAERLSPDVWRVTLRGSSEERRQQVLVMRELMQPDLEFVRVMSPVSALSDLHADVALRVLGQMTVGMIGHNPSDDGAGLVCIGTTIPLSCLDLSGTDFLLYLTILANAADGVEEQLGGVDLY